jgi:hypothetical protein
LIYNKYYYYKPDQELVLLEAIYGEAQKGYSELSLEPARKYPKSSTKEKVEVELEVEGVEVEVDNLYFLLVE